MDYSGMEFLTVTNILIGMGAVIMAFNVKKFIGIKYLLEALSSYQYRSLKPVLIFHHFLIICFFIGYLIVLIALNSTKMSMGEVLISVIFFSGAIFVFISIHIQKKMIASIDAAYQSTLAANTELSNHQKKLTETNQNLTQEVNEHIITGTRLQRSYDTQTIVNQILKDSLTESSIMEVVNHCLDLLLSIPWLSFKSQGCIFLVEDKSDVLVLKAHRGLSQTLEKECGTLPFGKCLCGLAALTQETVYAANIDARHEIMFPGIDDHGHYCIPILARERTIGLITIYVEPGHKRSDWEEDFLIAVANTLAVILMQRYGEQRKNEMEALLYQTQKMESIGTLAGGIAHDFNNILSGIFGYTQLALMHLDEPKELKTKLSEIYKGATRASDLIQQILTFSRKAEFKKVPVKISGVVREAVKFLRSSIPASIQIIEDISSKGYVMAEPTKIHQIMMNLCTNAFHSMRETGGDLTILLTDEVYTQNQADALSIRSGPYVKLEIRDTGPGMPREIRDKIFEPYFTTKKKKEGTGLGLSVVLGIVQEHNGVIKSFSQPGAGTYFELYFPEFSEKNDVAGALEKKQREITGGTERILLVDDEETILESTCELLKDYGYAVAPFKNSKSAFERFKREPDGFDLVITDMTMPEMTGEDLARTLLDIRPDIPIILCTGYSDAMSKNKALKMGIKKYLQKPVDSNTVLFLIRKILDEN